MAIAILLFLIALIVGGALVYAFAPRVQTLGVVAFAVGLLVLAETFAHLNGFRVLP